MGAQLSQGPGENPEKRNQTDGHLPPLQKPNETELLCAVRRVGQPVLDYVPDNLRRQYCEQLKAVLQTALLDPVLLKLLSDARSKFHFVPLASVSRAPEFLEKAAFLDAVAPATRWIAEMVDEDSFTASIVEAAGWKRNFAFISTETWNNFPRLLAAVGRELHRGCVDETFDASPAEHCRSEVRARQANIHSIGIWTRFFDEVKFPDHDDFLESLVSLCAAENAHIELWEKRLNRIRE